MRETRWTAGSILVIAVCTVVIIVAALRWMGANRATIGAGIGVLFQVCVLVTVAAGICAGAITLISRRRAAAQPAPEPAPAVQHVTAEQVPLTAAPPDEPLALPPGGAHLHFHGLSVDEAAEVVRQANERR